MRLRISTAVVTALVAVSLSACGTLQLTGNPAADAKATVANVGAATNPQQFAANVKAFNDALGQVCTGTGNFDWTPPLPPMGSLHAQCTFGKQALSPMGQQFSDAVKASEAAPAAPAAP